MNKTEVYKKPIRGEWDYENEEKHKELLGEGWKVLSAEITKEWDPTITCCLLAFFWPLFMFGKRDVVTVIYEKAGK